MGIFYPEDSGEHSLRDVVLQPGGKTLCYFCGDPIFGLKPVVFWHGFISDSLPAEAAWILLHADCAVNLSPHLAKDGLLAQRGQRVPPIKRL